VGLLQGKVALVTGATSGVGLSAAEIFAREGAKVAMVGRREAIGSEAAQRIRSLGGEARFFPADISLSGEVKAMVKAVVDTYGKLDVAFNNAGVGSNRKTIADTNESEFDTIIDIDLKGAFLCLKYQIPELKAPGASVIFTSSVAAFVGAPLRSAYSAAKGGMNAFVRAAAMELAPDGIRVNAICPAGIRTALMQAFFDRAALSPGGLQAAIAEMNARHPLGRIAEPEDVANVALFLASDLSSMITGQSILIDGGQSVGRLQP
jgi:NAD(P)-dependent dehydrogenase (short-subunit alcohol dehydrogenase family)